MIIAGLAAALLGVGQFFMDTVLFSAIFKKEPLKALPVLMLKMLLYGGGFALLFVWFREYVAGAAIGFGIGFFPGIFIYGLNLLRGGEKK